MPRSGHRHHLVLYTYMLNRWWKAILGIGIVLLVLAAGLISSLLAVFATLRSPLIASLHSE